MKWNTNHNGFREECVYYKERSLWVSYKTEENYYFSMLISLFGALFQLWKYLNELFPISNEHHVFKIQDKSSSCSREFQRPLENWKPSQLALPIFYSQKINDTNVSRPVICSHFSKDEKSNIWSPFYKVAYFMLSTKLKRDSKNENMTLLIEEANVSVINWSRNEKASFPP